MVHMQTSYMHIAQDFMLHMRVSIELLSLLRVLLQDVSLLTLGLHTLHKYKLWRHTIEPDISHSPVRLCVHMRVSKLRKAACKKRRLHATSLIDAWKTNNQWNRSGLNRTCYPDNHCQPHQTRRSTSNSDSSATSTEHNATLKCYSRQLKWYA